MEESFSSTWCYHFLIRGLTGQYGIVLLTVPLAYCQTQLEPHEPGKVTGCYCSPQALGRSSINTGIVWTSVSSGKLGWDNLATTTS